MGRAFAVTALGAIAVLLTACNTQLSTEPRPKTPEETRAELHTQLKRFSAAVDAWIDFFRDNPISDDPGVTVGEFYAAWEEGEQSVLVHIDNIEREAQALQDLVLEAHSAGIDINVTESTTSAFFTNIDTWLEVQRHPTDLAVCREAIPNASDEDALRDWPELVQCITMEVSLHPQLEDGQRAWEAINLTMADLEKAWSDT